MDLLQNLATGFGVALSFSNLAYAFFGCVLGTLIGVLPGLGPAAGTAILALKIGRASLAAALTDEGLADGNYSNATVEVPVLADALYEALWAPRMAACLGDTLPPPRERQSPRTSAYRIRASCWSSTWFSSPRKWRWKARTVAAWPGLSSWSSG